MTNSVSNKASQPIVIEVLTRVEVDPSDAQPVPSLLDLYETIDTEAEQLSQVITEAAARDGASVSVTSETRTIAPKSWDVIKSEPEA